MAQTAFAVTQLKTNTVVVNAGDLRVTLATGDTVNGNSFPLTGREILVISNPDASAHTVTIQSVVDHLGRSGDIPAYNIPAGEIHAINLNTLEGWQNAGNLNLTCNSALLKFGVIRY